MTAGRQVLSIAAKDILIEVRSRGMLVSVGVFSLGTLLVFAFAFEMHRLEPFRLVPGILWVTILFSALMALNRTFLLEEPQDSLVGLILAPVDRSVLYFGKVLGALAFLLLLQAVILLGTALWFSLSFNEAILLALIAVLGDVGLVAAGTLLASMAVRTRAREAVLPVLLLPVAFPWIIAGVKASAGVLAGDPFADYSHWIAVMAAFDAIFLTTGWLAFEHTIED